MTTSELYLMLYSADLVIMTKPLLTFFTGMAGVSAFIYVSRLIISNIR